MEEALKKNKTFKKSDFLLLFIALIFGPFTQLRLGRIGVTELSVIMLSLSVLSRRELNLNLRSREHFVFTKFWLFFLFFSFMGIGYNFIFLQHGSGRTNLILVDLLAYLISATVCFVLELLIYNDKRFNIYKLLEKIYYASSIIFFMLFIASLFTSSLLSFTLLQGQNFRPLATNVHHGAMSLAPLPFIGLIVMSFEKKIIKKLIVLFLIFSNIFIGFQMASTKLIMGFIIGAITLVYLYVLNKDNKKLYRTLIVVFSFALFLLLFSFFSNEIIYHITTFFKEEDGGGARETLWIYSVHKIFESPLVGFGPGPHAQLSDGRFFDAHQSILTVALQGGLLSVIAFVVMIIKIIFATSKHVLILPALMGIITYALGGDILRRLPMWIFLMLFYYYSIENKNQLAEGRTR